MLALYYLADGWSIIIILLAINSSHCTGKSSSCRLAKEQRIFSKESLIAIRPGIVVHGNCLHYRT